MIYLDNGATSFPKPDCVRQAVSNALLTCGNPGRGGYKASMNASRVVYNCREKVADFFGADPEQVVFTSNCTHGLNIAIKALVKPGNRVVVSGFEHNAVIRPLTALNAKIIVAGTRLFDPQDTINSFEAALRGGADAAVFTHISNVFGYILPVEELSALCTQYGVPFIVDAAQSAGVYPIHLQKLGASYIAAPGHKGLLGPQGTGVLLCNDLPDPILYGGTGSNSESAEMPLFLPDRLEAGTLNVPGIAGLAAGISFLKHRGIEEIACREAKEAARCGDFLLRKGFTAFCGNTQSGTVSFVCDDCEDFAEKLSGAGISVRAGLHCAPLAHRSAGTLDTGTVRISFGHSASKYQSLKLMEAIDSICRIHKKF